MVKGNKLGLVERCFLAGVMFVGGTLGGCQPLSYVQEQKLGTLTGLAIRNQEQKARNEAIANSGGKISIPVQPSKENKKITPATKEDVVYLKDGRVIRGEILVEKPNHIYIAEGKENVWSFPKNEILSYINK